MKTWLRARRLFAVPIIVNAIAAQMKIRAHDLVAGHAFHMAENAFDEDHGLIQLQKVKPVVHGCPFHQFSVRASPSSMLTLGSQPSALSFDMSTRRAAMAVGFARSCVILGEKPSALRSVAAIVF